MEQRIARFLENHIGKYNYGSNSNYDEAELSQIFASEIYRMAHRVTFNCLYGLKYDVYDSNIVPMSEKGLLYNIKSFLKNDEFIFDDFLNIV